MKKKKKPSKQTACLITKQGLRCYKKEKILHGTITEQFSFVIITVIILFYFYSLNLDRSPLPGASICAVPLSQPFPVKNYF